MKSGKDRTPGWLGRWTEGVAIGLFVNWLWPSLAAVAVGIVAWLSSLPWLFIILIALGTFAIVMLLLNELAVWRARSTATSPPTPTLDESEQRARERRLRSWREQEDQLRRYLAEGQQLFQRVPTLRAWDAPSHSARAAVEQAERDVQIWRDKVARAVLHWHPSERAFFLNCTDGPLREQLRCHIGRLEEVCRRVGERIAAGDSDSPAARP